MAFRMLERVMWVQAGWVLVILSDLDLIAPYAPCMVDDATIRIGGRTATIEDAHTWITSYFDAAENLTSKGPYAYPAYDQMDTGGDKDVLNDGDLLAPTLLNAAPSIVAFYSLRWAKPHLNNVLLTIPRDLTLARSVVDGTLTSILGDLVAVLDDPDRPMHGVRLTTLLKVLHRKRPLLIPFYDQFVRACYVGSTTEYPVPWRKKVDTKTFIVDVATAINADLEAQPARFPAKTWRPRSCREVVDARRPSLAHWQNSSNHDLNLLNLAS